MGPTYNSSSCQHKGVWAVFGIGMMSMRYSSLFTLAMLLLRPLELVAHRLGVVDISPLLYSGGEPTRAALELCVSAIDRELSTKGAFVAVGLNINEKRAFRAAKSLFSTPSKLLDEVKIQPNGFMRGYLPFGQETGLETHFEPKEGFSYGFDWSGSSWPKLNALHGDNVWPSRAEWGQDILEHLFSTEIEVAERLTEAISMALNDGNKTAFSEYVDPHGSTSVMRLFHYFALKDMEQKSDFREKVSDKTVMGSSPHTDWGYLTLILQDSVGGLQILYKDQWVDVPYIRDSLVVNAGDFLSMISGGRYVSPIHRVLSPVEKERMSFVLFYYPKFETPMDRSLFQRISDLHRQAVAIEAHNSLFKIVDDGKRKDTSMHSSDSSNKTFGEYIIQKWREVKAY